MALINCPECGKEISDKAPACIHCGFPIENVVVNNSMDDKVKIQDELLDNKNKSNIENAETQNDVSSEHSLEEKNSRDNLSNFSTKWMVALLGGFILLLIIVSVIQTANENKKQEAIQDAIAQQAISSYDNGNYVEALNKKRELEKDDKLGDYEQKIILMGNFQELYEGEDSSYICVLYFLGHYEEFEQQGLINTVYPLVIKSAQKVAGHGMNIAEQFERSMENEEISKKLEPMLSNNKEKLLEIMQQIDNDIDYDLAESDYEKYRKQLQEEYQAEYNASHPIQVTNDDCKITHSRGYYYCNGTVHNVSGSTHYYVKVKVTYYEVV